MRLVLTRGTQRYAGTWLGLTNLDKLRDQPSFFGVACQAKTISFPDIDMHSRSVIPWLTPALGSCGRIECHLASNWKAGMHGTLGSDQKTLDMLFKIRIYNRHIVLRCSWGCDSGPGSGVLAPDGDRNIIDTQYSPCWALHQRLFRQLYRQDVVLLSIHRSSPSSITRFCRNTSKWVQAESKGPESCSRCIYRNFRVEPGM